MLGDILTVKTGTVDKRQCLSTYLYYYSFNSFMALLGVIVV